MIAAAVAGILYAIARALKRLYAQSIGTASAPTA
jgi:hypothetical protein